MADSETELLYLQDAYVRSCQTTVVGIDGQHVAVEQTVMYPTGGGQPHDTGSLRWNDESAPVVGVKKKGVVVWHELGGDQLPDIGDAVTIEVDWDRRHELMRTHTALHILCGVIWNRWGTSVTGGNMSRLAARMDFEFDPLPDGFAGEVEQLVNTEIAADRPIEVSFLDRGVAVADDDLIRTKVNLIPEFVTTIRVIDIVGLDKQADGGTHVASTGEVGTFRVVKTESKGKGNKRLRIELS